MKLKWIVILAFILVALSLFMFFPKKNKDVPENLIGKWRTSEPRYQDRFFEITKETLIYGLGGDQTDVYFISSMEESLEGNNRLYTINYENADGLKFTQSFYYHPENGGSIQLKHQEHIKWKREKDDAVEESLKTDQNKKAGQNETNS
jgi:hypothetical protein